MGKIINRNKEMKRLTQEEYVSLVTDYRAYKMNGKDRLFTGEELAKKYGVSRQTVYKYLRRAEKELI